jgi:Tat protein secretion system quality control protein TatD with DNase activity
MFEFFLVKAGQLGLPLSIHTRAAEELCLEIVKKYSLPNKISTGSSKLSGVFHSYTGPLTLINEIKALGFYIGLNGIISYKSASHILRRVLRDLKGTMHPKTNENVDGDNSTLLKNLYHAGYVLETDAPYLVTAGADSKALKQAYGERLNDPAGVTDTLEFLGQQL